MGALLRDLHHALEGFAGDLPYLSPALADARDVLDNLEARGVMTNVEADAFRARIDACETALPPAGDGGSQALHGDAHARNTLCTSGGIVWTDFEDSCRGSVAWDLACLGRRLGPEAVAGYGEPRPTDAEIAAHTEARLVQGAIWERIFAARDAGALGLGRPDR
jgi:Ser/Thr protein kinase RdoA (MazF antagonist)